MSDVSPIRSARPDEAPALADFAWRLFTETFLEDLRAVYPESDLKAFREDSYAPELFAAWIASDAYGVRVAEDAQGLCAYAVTCPASFRLPGVEASHGEIKRLYVQRRAQGTGLAQAMFRDALDGLTRAGRTPVWLSVWSENHRARAFYLRHGFEKVADFAYRVGETLDDEHLMRWPASQVAADHGQD